MRAAFIDDRIDHAAESAEHLGGLPHPYRRNPLVRIAAGKSTGTPGSRDAARQTVPGGPIRPPVNISAAA